MFGAFCTCRYSSWIKLLPFYFKRERERELISSKSFIFTYWKSLQRSIISSVDCQSSMENVQFPWIASYFRLIMITRGLALETANSLDGESNPGNHKREKIKEKK